MLSSSHSSARNVVVVVAALILSVNALPTFAKDSGGYIGGSIGLTTIDVCGDLNALGFTSCDDEDTGIKIFGGYKFNPNLSVEGGFVDFGEISATAGTTRVTVESDAVFGAAVGSIPITSQFSVFGKAGLFIWDLTASGGGATITDDGTDFMFGVGLSYAFTDQVAARAEFESFDAGSDGVTMLSAGIQYTF